MDGENPQTITMTFNEIIKEYFPDATKDEAEAILWEHTGFPIFWNIPEDGKTPEECFRTQLAKLRRTINQKHLNAWDGKHCR